jgi:DNA-binding transcriptional LysR family regulator
MSNPLPDISFPAALASLYTHKLDTRALQMFVAVALSLNFRQAAEQLHMTQPPLSRAIRQLEQRLGVRLFERDTQGVALTPAAATLLPQARRILGLLDLAEQSLARERPVSAAAGTAGTQPLPLRLGLTTSVGAGSFTGLQAAFETQHGAAALRCSFDASPALVAAVRAGRLDAAIIALPCKTGVLAVQPLGWQALMAALPAPHALARRRSVALADLDGEKVFWFERARQPAYFDHCHAVFRQHGFIPEFVREPRDHHVLLSDVASGKAIALLPESFRTLALAGVAYRKLRQGAELAVGLGLVSAPALHPVPPGFAALSALALAMMTGTIQTSLQIR